VSTRDFFLKTMSDFETDQNFVTERHELKEMSIGKSWQLKLQMPTFQRKNFNLQYSQLCYLRYEKKNLFKIVQGTFSDTLHL